MATQLNQEHNTSSLNFVTANKEIVILQQKEKHARRKVRRKGSREVSTELIELTYEYANHSPHELASEGQLNVLRTRIDAFGLSLKTKDNQAHTLLHSATCTNQIDIMAYLIESGIQIDATDMVGNTALHIASIKEHIESLHLLLNHGANDCLCNDNDDAPLHIAVRSGNVCLVEAFIQHTNIDFAVQGYRNRTPLHTAAEYDYVDIIHVFSNCSLVIEEFKNKQSFQLCAVDDDKLTPIHFAARCGSAKVLNYMMTHCSNHGYTIETILQSLDEENSTPLHAAVDAGHINIVNVLLKFGASPVVRNGDQIPPLHLACYQGRIDIVQAMIEHSSRDIMFSVSAGGQTPLHWGAHSIHGGQVIHYLISEGANLKQVNDNGQTALHTAIIFGSLESAQELITADQTVALLCNNCQCNVIHLAVLHKRKAILHYLLQLPFVSELTRQQDNCNCTPLHYALINSLCDYVSALVSSMMPQICNIKDESGSNYLHLAARSGNCKATLNVLNCSAPSGMLNEMDSQGITPLHEAGMHGHIACVDLLLSEGAMLHKCYRGFTPFLSAVSHGHYECAKSLFEAHPYQRDWTNDKGENSLHLAVSSGSAHVLELCLDLSIPIIRNNIDKTFLDQIIESGDSISALAVINHSRWQECLDFPVIEPQLHYFVQLVKVMPDIAQSVLDRCHVKGSQPKEHVSYFERFDFKYLRLVEQEHVEGDDSSETDEEHKFLPHDEKDMMAAVTVKYKSSLPENHLVKFVKKRYSSMDVLRQMLRSHRISLLVHPVAVQYLKVKWRGYGRLIYGTHFLMFFLQVLLLSAFIMITPPPRLNVSDVSFEVTASNITITEVSSASTIIRFFALIVCIMNTIIWLANMFALRLEALNFTKHETIWMTAVTLASTYAFLMPWKFREFGFTFIIWEAGAIAIFAAWFTTGLLMKPFDLFGVYVTMFLEVMSTLLKAMLICGLFIIAFAFTLFILVGDITPFTSIGDSFFITFSYLLGEINYEVYVRRSDNNALLYPTLTYIFVLLAAIILSVVVMNLLIGLAVGDIDTIKRNALLRQRSNEVRILSKMEAWIPNIILQRYAKRFHTVYPNEPVPVIREIWRYFWRSLKAKESTTPPDLQKVLEEQQRNINNLQRQMLAIQRIRQQQHYELRDMLETLVHQRPDLD